MSKKGMSDKKHAAINQSIKDWGLNREYQKKLVILGERLPEWNGVIPAYEVYKGRNPIYEMTRTAAKAHVESSIDRALASYGMACAERGDLPNYSQTL